MGKKETYEVTYECCNCGAVFTKEIPKGIEAPHETKCPNCEVEDLAYKKLGKFRYNDFLGAKERIGK